MRYPFTCFLIHLFLLIGPLVTRAQTYRHSAIWLRLAPTYSLTTHWSLLGDLYYRRQSNPDQSLLNALDAPLVLAGRLGVSYRTKHWLYSVYPVSHFYTYPALGNTADLKRPPVAEWRPTLMAEWTLDMPHKSALRLRTGYEYRIFNSPDLPNIGRFRARALWRRGIGQHSYGQLWNETLFYAPPLLPGMSNVFDLNRTNLALGHAFSNWSTVEIGYQFTHRQRRSQIEFDNEHALTLTLFLKH
ncbi:DUF2490 domain-containing protein [Fibrella aquatilis]|uniref:DUF2490 domain-containing protein n=1 Tax=Fibrella aquatilis TaxID=2817059 RepID=A0A939G6H2_9BACT|nr:DUF2490 domain-containing protein [Fibrella aquatilis]MBO0930936.1 DUF2490 domain-containing protein [Fibrella aquatilis]